MSHSTKEAIVQEIKRQARGGPNVEPPTAAMFEGVYQERSSTAINYLLDDAAETADERGIRPAAVVSHLRTQLIDCLYYAYHEYGGEFSDKDRTDVSDWEEPLAILEASLTDARGVAVDHAFNIVEGAVTAPPDRANPPEAVAQLIGRERWPEGGLGLDIACSIMSTPLQQMYKAEFPMAVEKVTIEPPITDKIVDATPNYNRVLGWPSVFRYIVAVDVQQFYYEERQSYDYGRRETSLSGLRPSERNSAYIDKTRALTNKKQWGTPEYDPEPKVTFHRANLLDNKERADFLDEVGSQFNFINVGFLSQELTPADRLKAHGILWDMLTPDGVLVYTDQSYLHPANKRRSPHTIHNVVQYKNYATEAWRSSTRIGDKLLYPNGGLAEAARWFDNRCRVGRLGNATLLVNGEAVPFFDLVLNA